MTFTTLIILALIAGLTIFIGLPFGRLRKVSPTWRAALSMLGAGIIAYLLIEIMSEAAGQVSSVVRSAIASATATGAATGVATGVATGAVTTPATVAASSGSLATLLIILLLGGFFLGFVGLVAIQQKLVKAADGGARPERLSMMIAIGIGLHNLSEGLAIGQSAAQGLLGLSIGLVIGFGLHNATEGFGIVGPMMRDGKVVPWRAIVLLGLIGGLPTFIGTMLGSLWTSTPFSVFVLAMAGGALLFVLKELFNGVRKEQAQVLIMSALAFGFAVGWGTEVAASASMGSTGSNTAFCGQGQTSADGDSVSTTAGVGATNESASSTAGTGNATSSMNMGSQAAGSTAGGNTNYPNGVPGKGGSYANLNLTQAQIQKQDQLSADELHEKAMVPKILPDGTKQYTLTASVFPWHLYFGETVEAWGYNGQVPGPLIRVKVGDRVQIVVHNKLPEATTVHWHGLAVPNSMDGVPDATQAPIQPGGTFVYHFTITPQMIGTHYYHSHYDDDFQVDSGLHGLLIVDPANTAKAPHYDVDAIYELAAWKINNSDLENVFTMDGKPYPESPELNVKLGQRVLIRLVNTSAEEFHTMHLHGYTFQVVARDGNPVAHPESLNTIALGPGMTADIAFTANNPGKWMFHCHILDHTVNPNDEVDMMGGLMTYINVTK